VYDGPFDAACRCCRQHITDLHIADFAPRGFSSKAFGLFEAVDQGQRPLLKLLAGERQFDFFLGAAREKRDAEIGFKPFDLLAECRGAMFKRSAARAKCSSDATAAKSRRWRTSTQGL
jgi:hypothetical protein